MTIDWWTWHNTDQLRALLAILYSFLDICLLIYPNIQQKARALKCDGLYADLRDQVLSFWFDRSDLSGDFACRRTAGHDNFLLFGFFCSFSLLERENVGLWGFKDLRDLTDLICHGQSSKHWSLGNIWVIVSPTKHQYEKTHYIPSQSPWVNQVWKYFTCLSSFYWIKVLQCSSLRVIFMVYPPPDMLPPRPIILSLCGGVIVNKQLLSCWPWMIGQYKAWHICFFRQLNSKALSLSR